MLFVVDPSFRMIQGGLLLVRKPVVNMSLTLAGRSSSFGN
jgi:hypothetical protein